MTDFQSPKEWNALNAAYALVSDFVFGSANSEGVLDRELWFKDSPVSLAQRRSVKVIKQHFTLEGLAIERELRKYRDEQLTDEIRNVFLTIEGIGNGLAHLPNGSSTSEYYDMINGALLALKEGTCIVGSVALGDFADAYELISGKAVCSGETLTISERMLSGLGLVVGSGAFWRGAAKTVGILRETKLALNITASVMGKARIIGLKDNKAIERFALRLAEQFPCDIK